jgi:hypothetical protein
MADSSPPVERTDGTDGDAGTKPVVPVMSAADHASICIHHGGRCFITTQDRAGMFLRRVQAVCDRGASELVPLLHDGGVELLHIASNIPLQVHDVRDRSLDGGHLSRRTRA